MASSDPVQRQAKLDKAQLAAKIDWEGGILDTIADYGLRAEALPDDTPAEVVSAWENITTHVPAWVDVIEAWLDDDGTEREEADE